jgi:hypothetical protein
MATIPNAMLLCASSPYAQKGALFEAYRKYFGKSHRVLVWQADTRTMNPRVPQSFIDAETAEDPASASAEYGAQFRLDIEAYISREAVEACVASGVRERPRAAGVKYFAFTDPSGGSRDSFTLAISHRDKDSLVVDCVREVRPPFSPEDTVAEFCGTLKSYGVRQVTGDHYAGMWPAEQFKKRGITYEPCETPKSDLYRDCLPLINSRRAEFLDHPRLITQFANLERRTARSGHDSIDHPKGAFDDVANCVAGCLSLIAAKSAGMPKFSSTVIQRVKTGYRPPLSLRSRFHQPRAFFTTGNE